MTGLRGRRHCSWPSVDDSRFTRPQRQTLSGVSGLFLGGFGFIMLPEYVGMSILYANRCATGVNDGWFAVSRLGQSVCDPSLKLAASEYSLCSLSPGPQSVCVTGAEYQWANVCVDFR